MRRNSIFWGVILLVVGLVLLLNALGLLPGSAAGYIWPLLLVLVGVFMLLGPIFRRNRGQPQALAVPLEGAAQARVRLDHGAGRLLLGPTSEPGILLKGTFSEGVEDSVRRSGSQVEVVLRAIAPQAFPPFFYHEGNLWQIDLARDVPTRLELNTGANEARLDLTDLAVTELVLKTGASSTRVDLPACAGMTRVEVSSGAASVELRVPQDVAARIRATGGLAGITVDTSRFPRTGDSYETPGYELAQNRVEIRTETGVGSVDIR